MLVYISVFFSPPNVAQFIAHLRFQRFYLLFATHDLGVFIKHQIDMPITFRIFLTPRRRGHVDIDTIEVMQQ